MEPLSVGNVISAGLRIYRDNFKKYFWLAFLGYLWFFVPIIVLGIIGAIVVGALGQGTAASGILVLLFIAAIVCLVYGCARYYAIAGIISRLAYREIAEQPETVRDARRFVKPKMWKFLTAGILVSLIFLGAILVYLLVAGIIGGVISAISSQNLLASAAFGIILVLLAVFGFIWLLSRLFLIELPLAVEENVGATGSISRSWELTKNSIIRIQLVVFLAFLISIPVVLAVNIASFVLQVAISAGVANNPSLAAIAVILYVLVAIGGSAFMVPFWQAIKAVVYYDLRVRREGMGIDLRK